MIGRQDPFEVSDARVAVHDIGNRDADDDNEVNQQPMKKTGTSSQTINATSPAAAAASVHMNLSFERPGIRKIQLTSGIQPKSRGVKQQLPKRNIPAVFNSGKQINRHESVSSLSKLFTFSL